MVRRKRALRQKLRRDMRQNAMQFLAMVLLCFLGTWVFAGLDANWRMEEITIEGWISEGQLCDAWVTGPAISRQDVYRVETVPGVEQVQERVTLEAECPDLLPGEVNVTIHAFDGAPEMNIPRVQEGEGLTPGDTRGCLLEYQFAEAHGLKPGDVIRVSVQDVDWDFQIRGTVYSPEYMVTANDVGPDPNTYGFMITDIGAFPMFPVNQLLIRLADGADAAAAERAMTEILPEAVVLTQKTHSSTVQARNYVHLFRNMSYLFPVLAYFVAAMVVMTTIGRLLDTQRIQMGTLKALGYDNRQIRRHYLAYAIVPSVIGSAAGLFIAQITLPPVLWRMVDAYVKVPVVSYAPISALSWAMTGAEVLLAVALCLRHARRMIAESAADLLRPKPPKAGARILLERIHAVWDNGKMIIRNIFRNKGRTMMSMLGMLFCNMLIICSFGLQESIPYFVKEYYYGTVRYDTLLELKRGEAGTLDSYRARLDAEQVDGMMGASASLRSPDVTRTVSVTVLPEDTTLLRLGENHEPLALPPEGIVLTTKLAENLKVKAGDTVSLLPTGETDPIEMRVAGVAEINIGQSAYMSQTAWENLRKGEFRPTALMIRGATARGQQQIDEMDEIDVIRYPTEQEKQSLKAMDSATAAFSILSGVALGLAFVICYNMGLMNFTERTREYATLKVLGYHQREIRRLMLRENTLVSVVGVAAGIPPGILLVGIILKMCEFDSMVFEAHITWPTVLFSSAVTFAFTWMIQRLLTRKVKKIDMVEALKSVE